MKRNLGTTDRIIRIVLASTLGFLIYFGIIGNTYATAAAIVAFVLLWNALIGACGIYAMLGISTGKTCTYKPVNKKND